MGKINCGISPQEGLKGKEPEGAEAGYVSWGYISKSISASVLAMKERGLAETVGAPVLQPSRWPPTLSMASAVTIICIGETLHACPSRPKDPRASGASVICLPSQDQFLHSPSPQC